MSTLVVKDKIEIGFDVLLKLKKSEADPSAVDIILDSILVDSLEFDKKYMKVRWLEGKVITSIKSKLETAGRSLKYQDSKIAENVSIAPNLLGIPLHINGMHIDSFGHIVLFLDYGVKL
jgi:hypothetical protein